MSASSIKPDPSVIGGISKAPFALMTHPARLFSERATRFRRLAEGHRLSPYLNFLAGISDIQAVIADELPPIEPVNAERVEQARAGAMPPIDRSVLASSPELKALVWLFAEKVAELAKPAAAAEALAAVKAADDETLEWMLGNVLADNLPVESLAHHLYVAAAVQVHLARLAGGLDAARLVPVATGVCPACGGKPAGSMVIGVQGAEGARYACCSSCATRWNEVRVKCIACGSTKGIGYRSVEEGTVDEEATIKAEVCDTCHSWTKLLYQNRNPSLEMIADDVASLGLDLLMKDSDYRRAGFNPFLVGY